MSSTRRFAGFGALDYYGPGSPDYNYQPIITTYADQIGKSYIDPAFYLPPPAQPARSGSISFNPSEVTIEPTPAQDSAPTLYDQAFGPAAPGSPPLMLFAGLGILAVGLYLVWK